MFESSFQVIWFYAISIRGHGHKQEWGYCIAGKACILTGSLQVWIIGTSILDPCGFRNDFAELPEAKRQKM